MEIGGGKPVFNNTGLDDGITIQKKQQELASAIRKVIPFLTGTNGDNFTSSLYRSINYLMRLAVENEKEHSVSLNDEVIMNGEFLENRKHFLKKGFIKSLVV